MANKLVMSLTQLAIAVKVSIELNDMDKQSFLNSLNFIQDEMRKFHSKRDDELIKRKIKNMTALAANTRIIQALWSASRSLILADFPSEVVSEEY
jgi:hypothetical protein